MLTVLKLLVFGNENFRSDDDVFSMDGTTTGGEKGSVIECFGIATGGQGSATAVWHLYSPLLIGDGTLATPFA